MKIPGLSRDGYEHLAAIAAGEASEAPQSVVRHCELKGWVRGGGLTDDGRHVLARAMEDPPEGVRSRQDNTRERKRGGRALGDEGHEAATD